MTLTLAQAAKQIHCSRSHLHRIIRGEIRDVPSLPVIRLGRKTLIWHETFVAWLQVLEDREIEVKRVMGCAVTAIRNVRSR